MLFRSVVNGFSQEVDSKLLVNQGEYEPSALLRNLIFGTPEEAVDKLKHYEVLGVDYFCYCASYGLPMPAQKKSLRLFIDEVMPAFQDSPAKLAMAQ